MADQLFSCYAPKSLTVDLIATLGSVHYNIETWFTGNPDNLTAVSTHSVKLNWYGNNRSEILFSGTYRQCYDFIQHLYNLDKTNQGY